MYRVRGAIASSPRGEFFPYHLLLKYWNVNLEGQGWGEVSKFFVNVNIF